MIDLNNKQLHHLLYNILTLLYIQYFINLLFLNVCIKDAILIHPNINEHRIQHQQQIFITVLIINIFSRIYEIPILILIEKIFLRVLYLIIEQVLLIFVMIISLIQPLKNIYANQYFMIIDK